MTGSKLAIDVVSQKTARPSPVGSVPSHVHYYRSWPIAGRRVLALVLGGLGALGATALLAPRSASARTAGFEGSAPSCYVTGGGGLEICRDGSEAEGVLIAPAPCAFVRGVQILKLPRSEAPGPIQTVFQGQTPIASRREEPCPERRATDSRDGGSLRTGRTVEALVTTLPPSADRFWVDLPEERARSRGWSEPTPAAEGIGPRDPIAIAGRDWAGEAYSYVFLLGQERVGMADAQDDARRRGRRRAEPDAAGPGPADVRRRVQIEARTLDFQSFEIRTRAADGYGLAWTPFEPKDSAKSGRGRSDPPSPAPVIDEAGKPVASVCTAPAFETHGLAGSISIVERTYHYVYTDVLPEDCGLAPDKRRTALYLRTAQDLSGPKVWSVAKKLAGPLPPGSLVRVARAKGLQRWAVSYTCQRPANAPGGPVADICLQYTADMNLDGIGALKLYADPVEAGRSPAYLGLRSGGDGSGRFDRSAHFWMTDAQGNLDTPSIYPNKAGFLTWLDRLAPTASGRDTSSLYGRPVYWATWTVRRTDAQ
ncbi:hypothetical protein SAMN05216360_113112 [Methylobacterium phyllostachyos]|uniref:Uncharacterized protein n=1 Tax=Methylobacterium phyllostachyos TaxID=582672 RepID=A0A1H0FUZ3_9HYPH|nr:hypothetical protein SAMN05216360_113112 [Methylobacterium phyllostachyos]